MFMMHASSGAHRTLVRSMLAISIAALSSASAASAQLSEGPLSPGTVANDAVSGTALWVSPQEADTSDGVLTTTSPGGLPTQFLKATSFGFSIPSPAQITGIEVSVERASVAGTIVDSAVRIVKGGVVGATDRALPGAWPTGAAVTVVYGNSSDLWGETWTPADVNAAGFGAAISVTDGFDAAGVDHISVTVHYTLCAATPAVGCRSADKSVIVVNDKTPDSKDKLVWKWIKGASTSTAEFSDPINSATYSLCVYSAPAENLIANATVPPSMTRWKALSTKGFKYLDKNLTQDGVQKIIVKASVIDKAKVIFKGKGTGLPDITPMLTLPVKVQMVNSDSGVCWEASYDVPDIKKNESGKFKAVAIN